MMSANFQNVNYFLVVSNSSINFIVYCVVGKEFRTRMLRFLPCRLRNWRENSNFQSEARVPNRVNSTVGLNNVALAHNRRF